MHLFFSTPIWTSKIEEYQTVNDNMLNYISNLQKKDPDGVLKSNFKGWHSKNFNMKDGEPKNFIEKIKININTAIIDMGWDLQTQEVKISNMWAIINKKGSLNQKHHHSNSDLSAAYYVSAEKNCGDIIFYDPRPAKIYKHPIAKNPNILNATISSISPQPGMLILFPSFLEHSVDPNLSDHKRVVISFNLNLDKK
ncbi:TIGR02466 family protein [Alphaproteobacteria bacterium]|nr:TIGR02466 family protein [Alphaproteobacteria bacterium]